MHKDQYNINENKKESSYQLLRDQTDEENKIIEPYKPRKKKLHQLFFMGIKKIKKKIKK
tara:strand:+ start:52 stop:228 length:177 start_codon:yes stop_codon:yes gene_type:complete